VQHWRDVATNSADDFLGEDSGPEPGVGSGPPAIPAPRGPADEPRRPVRRRNRRRPGRPRGPGA
jgi:hypothetical protein